MEEEKFKLRVSTLADTEEQEVILRATGHFATVEEAADKGRELARAMLAIGGGFAAQIDARLGEEPNMRQLTLLLYPADGEEPEEEIVQTDIRPGEGAWKI